MSLIKGVEKENQQGCAVRGELPGISCVQAQCRGHTCQHASGGVPASGRFLDYCFLQVFSQRLDTVVL